MVGTGCSAPVSTRAAVTSTTVSSSARLTSTTCWSVRKPSNDAITRLARFVVDLLLREHLGRIGLDARDLVDLTKARNDSRQLGPLVHLPREVEQEAVDHERGVDGLGLLAVRSYGRAVDELEVRDGRELEGEEPLLGGDAARERELLVVAHAQLGEQRAEVASRRFVDLQRSLETIGRDEALAMDHAQEGAVGVLVALDEGHSSPCRRRPSAGPARSPARACLPSG